MCFYSCHLLVSNRDGDREMLSICKRPQNHLPASVCIAFWISQYWVSCHHLSRVACDREPLLLFFPGLGFVSSPCGGPITATPFPHHVPGLFSRAALRSQPRREGTAGGRDRAGLPSPYSYHRPAEDGPAEPWAGQWGEGLWHRSWPSNGSKPNTGIVATDSVPCVMH